MPTKTKHDLNAEESARLTMLTEEGFKIHLSKVDTEGYIRWASIEEQKGGFEQLFFPKLEYFSIFYSEIDDFTFLSKNKHLDNVDFSFCDFKITPSFKNLPNLLHLDLNRNKLTRIPELSGLDHLRTLYLSDNNLTKIENLHQIESLQHLNLSHNKITNIEGLQNLPNLKSLNLYDNKITNIEGLQNLVNLKELSLYNNQIEDLNQFKNLENMKILESIDLSNNKITDLKVTQKLPNLKSLKINDNKIAKISALKNLTALEELYLWRNKIPKIENFYNLPKLKHIRVEDNPINTIESLEHVAPHFQLYYIDKKYINEKQLRNIFKYLRTIDVRYEYEADAEEENEEDAISLYIFKKPRRKTYQINEFLVVDLDDDDRIVVYVDGLRVERCAPLFIEIDGPLFEGHEIIASIDHAAQKYASKRNFNLAPEELFWGHCSNLQAWAEHNYDSRLLHAKSAFPLLKKLTEAGDPVAKKVFKEEIAKRYASGHPTVVKFLKNEGYLKYPTKDEISAI